MKLCKAISIYLLLISTLTFTNGTANAAIITLHTHSQTIDMGKSVILTVQANPHARLWP